MPIRARRMGSRCPALSGTKARQAQFLSKFPPRGRRLFALMDWALSPLLFRAGLPSSKEIPSCGIDPGKLWLTQGMVGRRNCGRRLVVESLEDRTLLAASVNDGRLIIVGTGGSDQIVVDQLGSRIFVNDNGRRHEFQLSQIYNRLVFFQGYMGNDYFGTSTLRDLAVWADGGPGNDEIHGSDRNDRITGGHGHDTIFAKGGNDHLWGQSGNDVIFAGAGNDYVEGMDGNDRLYGDAGDDHLRGGNGADFLNGQAGHDWLEGESDNDRLFGGYGNDRVYGGLGNDILWGDEGNDVVWGGPGNDTLYKYSSHGYDWLYADSGDDEIWMISGDYLNDGSGRDRIYLNGRYIGTR
jgi:Ca2+-binding RTX toxin-like protein